MRCCGATGARGSRLGRTFLGVTATVALAQACAFANDDKDVSKKDPSSSVQKQAQEENDVAGSWKRIATAERGEIYHFDGRDGYLVWVERRLDAKTRLHVAQSFWYRLHRHRVRTGKTESIPIAHIHAMPNLAVGGDGAVAVGTARDVRLWLPGADPVKFDLRDLEFDTHDQPRAIYSDAWLCIRHFGSHLGIVRLRANEWRPDRRGRGSALISSGEARPFQELRNAPLFWNGSDVLYTVTFKDWRNEKQVELRRTLLGGLPPRWGIPGVAVGLDERYAFAMPRGAVLGATDLYRRKVRGPAPIERLRFPRPLRRMIAFHPPHFVALFKGGEEADEPTFIAALDVDRGEASFFGGYPLPRARTRAARGSPAQIRDPWPDRMIGFAADPASNQIFVATESAIYKLTAKPHPLEWPSFGWKEFDPEW